MQLLPQMVLVHLLAVLPNTGITVADQWRLTTNLTGITSQFITL